jgi:cyclopropane-fatty-acyl-phospholipid synthase
MPDPEAKGTTMPTTQASQSQRPQLTPDTPSSGRVHTWERRLFAQFLAQYGNPPVEFTLWDGAAVEPVPDKPLVHVRIKTRAALLRLLVDADFYFGEGYRNGEIEVDDLPRFLDILFQHMVNSPRRRRFHVWSSNTVAAARKQIHAHYDLGNDFYKLWLDDRMVYSCGYFPQPGMSLEAGQLAKMEHICRKLRLRAGECVVDVGCGWGALALHMAGRHGVSVRGFSLSGEQVAFAREQARRQSLSRQVEFIEDDYRNLTGSYDAFASVGMLEHVGLDNYRAFGDVVDRCLASSGRGLIQTIGFHKPILLNRWIASRIFPGAELPSLGELMPIFEPHDLCVLDVENLRLHYAETLRHWLSRFEQHAEEVAALFDPEFVRMWRFYLASSAASFSGGSLQLYQVLFNRQRCNDIPRSREHLYEPRA